VSVFHYLYSFSLSWHVSVYLGLSQSIPSTSNWPVSVCLRIVSISLLVTIYPFSLYTVSTWLLSVCLRIASVSLLVTIQFFSLYLTGDWWVYGWDLWAFHFLSLSTHSPSIQYLTGECLPENCQRLTSCHYTANNFGLMYSRKRISQNSFPNLIYIFPKSFMILCQELSNPKRNYKNQIWT
jgi:hypothetical protein